MNNTSDFFEALKANNIPMVKSFFETNPQIVNEKLEDQQSPLHWAASLGLGEMSELLVESGANVDSMEPYGNFPLWEATRDEKDSRLNDFLLEEPFRFFSPEEVSSGKALSEKCSDIFAALKYIDRLAVKDFIKIYVDVNTKDEDGWTPLHWAALENSREVVEVLVSHDADVNAKDNYGCTPLHWAALKNSHEIAEILMFHGANVNAKVINVDEKEVFFGMTPLHFATTRKVAEVLVSYGADINEEDALGYTPLHWAAYNGNVEVVEVLVAKGAQSNDFYLRPLFAATCEGACEVAEVLISHGADVNAKDKDGWTPLHWVWLCEVAEVLISHGADVNAKDENGCTPLHMAVSRGFFDMAEILIFHGADVNAKDNIGWNPLHVVAFKDPNKQPEMHFQDADVKFDDWLDDWKSAVLIINYKMVEMLISHGADAKAMNNDGWTPLRSACNSGNDEMISLLLAKGACVNSVCEENGAAPLHGS